MLWVILVLITATPVARSQSQPNAIEASRLSATTSGNGLPHGWKHVTFRRIKQPTRYSLVRDEGRVVVRAVSQQGASLLAKEIEIDPGKYPIINWQWKVANIMTKGDVFEKKGDDCPARLFVIFSDNNRRTGLPDRAQDQVQQSMFKNLQYRRVLAYIWGNKAASETMVPNRFSSKVVMFVVRSGPQNLNTWHLEHRNVYEDFQKAFGEKPSMISGIAIMTDSDNTGESAKAFYGDITFSKNPAGKQPQP